MTRRRFHTLDVFTQTALSGNPLAVVIDTDGLDAARMQAIAAEFNLSETVFVLEPRDPVNTARLRIFTPRAELPFAGHPTVGAAVLIAQLRAPDLLARNELRIVLEEGIGPVVCSVGHIRGRAPRGTLTLPLLPERLASPPARDVLAAALSLDPADIGFDHHVPAVFSAGVPFTFVPLATRAALARARPDSARWTALAEGPAAGVFAYAPEVDREDHAFSARMFAPSLGIAEDPATGSAVAALAGVVAAFDRPADGEHELVIAQGYDMGRPSEIVLGLEIAGGALVSASVGGAVVRVQEGTIDA